MKAVCWNGKKSVAVEEVPLPRLINPRDAIVRVTSTAICGSDLHLYNGVMPSMMKGDILGHEFMGEVMEVGRGVKNLRPGDRVVVPFTIACGGCNPCSQGHTSMCDNSNPNSLMADALYEHSGSGLFGYSHLTGGYAGGQAEYVRVPFADVGPFKVNLDIPDEKILFLSDILPTAYMAVEQSGARPGDVVAIWGCGPVGLLAIACARLIGVENVIAIDGVRGRLDLAREAGATVIDTLSNDVLDVLDRLTGGRGPDVCIDAVGLEATGHGMAAVYDRVKLALHLTTDRPTALRQAIQACKKGGTVSMPGVYGGFADKFPIGAAFGKGLKLVGGQTHVHRYMQPLLDLILERELDTSFIVTHRGTLDEAPALYQQFLEDRDSTVKVVLSTGSQSRG